MLVKDLQRHPVRGDAVHVDLLRVDMKVAIQTHVTLELTGADHAPGVIEGGVLSQGAVEINIEALPGDIPDALHFDVSGMEMNDTLTLAQLTAARGRHAARRSRRDRARDGHAADEGAGAGGDRDRDRARRRGRGRRGARAARPRATPARRPSSSASDDEC